MSQPFTHLHAHTHYSLLDGLPKIDELIAYVQKLGMNSVAITDHGALYGAVEFYKKAKKAGVKPIIGCEVYTAFEQMGQKRPNIDDKRYHLILLAKNEIGYRNLVKLVTKSHLEGFYYKPRVDDELLAKYCEGLIALSACVKGKIPFLAASNKLEEAAELAKKYQKIFGQENFFLEIQQHPSIPESTKATTALIDFSKKLNMPLVATNDCHYLRPDDAEAQDILMLINTGAKIDDPKRLTMKNADFSMRTPQQMADFCEQVKAPEAISNTQIISEMCRFEFKLGETKLPSFATPDNQNPNDYLKKLCYEGLAKKSDQIENNAITQERLAYELSVIEGTGFAPYFLIVQDFVNWAKQNRIVVGPGRGCFLPGTKILMDDGKQKPIEEVRPKEKVISHLGEKRKVKKILDYEVKEEIVIIESKMPAFNLKLTKDHQVFAARHIMCPVAPTKPTICKITCGRACKAKSYQNYKLEWIQAKDLNKNDFLLYPITKTKNTTRQKIIFDLLNLNNLDSRLKGDDRYVWYETGSNNLIQKKIKRFIKLDEKLARLFGFYIAEGWSRTRRKYREAVIGFGFNKDEKSYISEVRTLLLDVFGLDSSIKIHKTRHSCQVFGYSRIVAKFFERLCGKYAANKHIPSQAMTSNNRIIIPLLTTLFMGDGSNKGAMRLSFDSTSYNLASQVKVLLAKLDIMSSINIREHIGKNWHSSFKVRVSGKQLLGFNKLFPEFQIPIKKQAFYRNDTFIKQNYIWFPVKKVSFEKYKGKVYDLTIEKDSSYVANDIAVHNSAAGSLVSFLLNITEVEPIKYDLLFERFLNKDRIAMPDIDLDFTDRRRDEVINYVAEKYGRDKVAQIITFGTMAARAVIRDVGRALSLPYSFCDQAAKMIPFGLNLEQSLDKVTEFRTLYQTDSQAKKLIDLAKKLEGVARHASTHACGVIISNQPLDEIVPTQHPTQNDNNIITQYEMHSIDDLGLLKIDFLGLKNLTIIEDTLLRIYKVHGKNLDLSQIPMDDEATMTLFKEAKTTGVFQLESNGIKRYLKELRPTCFDDIVAMIALYRPGPMELIPEYIARKNNRQSIEYIHPSLKEVLKNTYGLPVYQEQIMKIAQVLAGFSLAEADILRKAIGKKIKELLASQKEKFLEGCVKNNVSKSIAEKVFSWIEPHASYSFNKSHAVAYGIIAYNTAYLKAHYPVEFMAALLTSEKNDMDKIAFVIDECKAMGIEVLAPDINESFRNFSVTPDTEKIRFGLLAIKNVGENIVEAILQERKDQGPFQSFSDFATRIDSKDFNKKSLESLIKSGAFDKFAERNVLLGNLEEALSFNREIRKAKANSQPSLFGFANLTPPSLHLADFSPATAKQKIMWEKELLGLYISSHPLDNFKNILRDRATPLKELNNGVFYNTIRVGGIISSVKKIITKKGQPMIFLQLQDLTDKAEVVIFPSVLEANPEIFQENKIVLITGKKDTRNGEPKIIAQLVEEILEA